MIRKDGGTAFPMQDPQAIHAYAQAATEAANHDRVEDRDKTYIAARAEAVSGLSIRDYFAAKALQGMSANPYYDDFDWDKIAEMAFAQAEAMLAERAK